MFLEFPFREEGGSVKNGQRFPFFRHWTLYTVPKSATTHSVSQSIKYTQYCHVSLSLWPIQPQAQVQKEHFRRLFFSGAFEWKGCQKEMDTLLVTYLNLPFLLVRNKDCFPRSYLVIEVDFLFYLYNNVCSVLRNRKICRFSRSRLDPEVLGPTTQPQNLAIWHHKGTNLLKYGMECVDMIIYISIFITVWAPKINRFVPLCLTPPETVVFGVGRALGLSTRTDLSEAHQL